MSLFGGLYVGKSGLQTSQNALNTVAHNLSNQNTTGYVRQQVAMTDTYYNTISTTKAISNSQTGDGVRYSEVRHIRDYFFDMKYREESGRYSFYETSYSTTLEIEDILGELDGAAFKDSLDGLWTAMEELSKTPSDSTYMSMLVSKAASFVQNATSVYQSFIEYQDNLNLQIKDAVDEINAIGTRIDELNKKISMIETGGIEKANDLRDERDLLIDTLAGYGNITYSEDANSRVTVRFNGTDFVTGAYKMGLQQDDETGFYTPYWEQNAIKTTDGNGREVLDISVAHVFKLSETISTDAGTDVGGLRALLLARGDHVANFLDLSNNATQKKLDALKLNSIDEYNKDPEGYEQKYYNDNIANSLMMNIEAEFDNLVHAVVTKVNEVLADNCDPKSGYLCNDDGTPMQLFLKGSYTPYEKITDKNEIQAAKDSGAKLYEIYDENGNGTRTYWKYVEEYDASDPDSRKNLYNCANLKINQELVQTPSKLGFVKEDGSTGYSLGKQLLKAFEDAEIYINPNATKASSFENCYTEIVNQMSTMGNVFKDVYEYQQLAVEQAESNRQSVIGVSSDEELEHMIMYQNAYNAASRYINVINTLLDSVISMAQ
mgnify:FL=1